MEHICGLYFVTNGSNQWRQTRNYLPQVELESHTKITPVCFTTNLQQKFSNSCNHTLEELRYTFPLYDSVSVCGYTIRYGEKSLHGVVKHKEEAKKTYQEAVAKGETASLLDSLPAGVFGVTIGNLPAKTDVYVDIEYAGELKHDAGIDGLRYTLPTSICPRYGDYPSSIATSNISGKGVKITIDVDVGSSNIRRIQSPSHPIAVSMGNLSTESTSDNYMPSKASATLTQGTTGLSADIILQLLIDDCSKPRAVIEKHETLNSRAVMATFVPKFNVKLASPEIVFVADQSGSMEGSKNAELVAALQVFLKSLPFGVRFNICAFGDHYKYLWPKSQAYNEENFKKASNFVRTFKAQYGGTEMFEPIKQAFKQRLADLPLEIMLLTDGEIWQEQELFELINQQIHHEKVDARVFALGIGSDVSHTLVEGVARAGNGFAQFVVENEETDQKLIRMLKASLFPHTKDYTLEVNFDDRTSHDDDDDFEIVEQVNNILHLQDDAQPSQPASFFDQDANMDDIETPDRYAHLPTVVIPKVLQAPSIIPPFFPFNRTYLYLILGHDAPQKRVASVVIRAQSASGPMELNIPVDDIGSGETVHQLAARKAVQDLEEGRGWLQSSRTVEGELVKEKCKSRIDEMVEREAVRLGETYQVAGKWCSFVAVQEDGIASGDVEAEGAKSPSLHTRSKRKRAAYSRVATSGSLRPDMIGVPGAAPISAFGIRARRVYAACSGPLADDDDEPLVRPSTADEDVDEEEADEDEDMGHGLFDATADMIVDCALTDELIEEKVVQDLPETTTLTPAALLRAIVDLQTFSGSWKWSTRLLQLMSLEEASLNLIGDELNATTLTLTFLQLKMSSQKDTWELVVAKAEAWLQGQISEDQMEVKMKNVLMLFSSA